MGRRVAFWTATAALAALAAGSLGTCAQRRLHDPRDAIRGESDRWSAGDEARIRWGAHPPLRRGAGRAAQHLRTGIGKIDDQLNLATGAVFLSLPGRKLFTNVVPRDPSAPERPILSNWYPRAPRLWDADAPGPFLQKYEDGSLAAWFPNLSTVRFKATNGQWKPESPLHALRLTAEGAGFVLVDAAGTRFDLVPSRAIAGRWVSASEEDRFGNRTRASYDPAHGGLVEFMGAFGVVVASYAWSPLGDDPDPVDGGAGDAGDGAVDGSNAGDAADAGDGGDAGDAGDDASDGGAADAGSDASDAGPPDPVGAVIGGSGGLAWRRVPGSVSGRTRLDFAHDDAGLVTRFADPPESLTDQADSALRVDVRWATFNLDPNDGPEALVTGWTVRGQGTELGVYENASIDYTPEGWVQALHLGKTSADAITVRYGDVLDTQDAILRKVVEVRVGVLEEGQEAENDAEIYQVEFEGDFGEDGAADRVRLARVVTPGGETAFTYPLPVGSDDPRALLPIAEVVTAEGEVTRTDAEYDANGLPTRVRTSVNGLPVGEERQTYTTLSSGLLVPSGNETFLPGDGLQKLDGVATEIVSPRTPGGQLDPQGGPRATTFTDGQGRRMGLEVQKAQQGAGQLWSLQSQSVRETVGVTKGRINRLTLANGSTQTFTRDGSQRVTRIDTTDIGGNTTSVKLAYDGRGQLASIADEFGDVTTFEYEARSGLLLAMRSPEGVVELARKAASAVPAIGLDQGVVTLTRDGTGVRPRLWAGVQDTCGRPLSQWLAQDAADESSLRVLVDTKYAHTCYELPPQCREENEQHPCRSTPLAGYYEAWCPALCRCVPSCICNIPSPLGGCDLHEDVWIKQGYNRTCNTSFNPRCPPR